MNLRTWYTMLIVWGVFGLVVSASSFAADTVKLARTGDPNVTVIHSPTVNDKPIRYMLNGVRFTMNPGQSQKFNQDRDWIIEFDRGDSHGCARYSLKDATYKFKMTDNGWELFQAANAALTATSNDTVEVTINGEEFTTYQFAKSLPKPFFSPVKVAGTQISRPIVGEDYKGDHPHHKGIWVSVDEVNDIKFWAEKGKLENRGVELLVAEGNPAKLKTETHWLGPDGQAVLIETTTIAIHANRLLNYDIRFKMANSDVHFKDTKEGLLGFRIAESMREDKGSGIITNAEGKNGSKECWGQRSAWVDYVGPVDGKTFGVTIFDHPKNFRPSRYHVRNYGLFSVSPFGEAAYTNNAEKPVDDVFPKGSELRMRYGIFFHSGDAASAKLADVNAQFLKAAE